MIRKPSIFYIVINLFLILFTVICLYPFLHIVSVSLSGIYAQMRGEVTFFPREFTTYSFQRVLREGTVVHSLLNSMLYTTVGTAVSLFLTLSMAYGLSKKRLTLRAFYMVMVVVTMFFGGGLIPLFLLVRSLGMLNTMWALIIPGAISAFNLIIMRTFFQSIPDALEESAFLDGANDITVFLKIALPISKAATATIGLFYAVAIWNNWFNAFIYLRERVKYPLQLILREIVIEHQVQEELMMETISRIPEKVDMKNMLTVESIKYATLVFSIVPMLIVYPFIQKYFVKGVMIGSLKE